MEIDYGFLFFFFGFKRNLAEPVRRRMIFGDTWNIRVELNRSPSVRLFLCDFEP